MIINLPLRARVRIIEIDQELRPIEAWTRTTSPRIVRIKLVPGEKGYVLEHWYQLNAVSVRLDRGYDVMRLPDTWVERIGRTKSNP